jgi:uncharacterized protein YbbK (DUF523 family)
MDDDIVVDQEFLGMFSEALDKYLDKYKKEKAVEFKPEQHRGLPLGRIYVPPLGAYVYTKRSPVCGESTVRSNWGRTATFKR